ncbi:MAG: helix-turn-helix domain-containing protein [Methylococcaceae bacterium]|nr:helix-turn-helix domain-containing protein [Methylococcaceae bacterium]
MNTQDKAAHWSNHSVKCHDCGLKKQCFPNTLSQQETLALENIVTSHYGYQRNDYLYHAGDFLNKLVIIKSGSAKTELVSEYGAEQLVGFHFSGDLLGLDCTSHKRTLTSVVFLENASVCTIPYQAFNVLSEQIPQLHYEMMRRLHDEVSMSQQLILAMNNHSAEQRVVIFLQDLARRQYRRGLSKDNLHLSMSRADIANYLGLASATVSRIISKFERDGLLAVENRHLQLTNYQALMNTVQACA